MNANRLEAFSDGVMAVALTIMVIELKPPARPEWSALLALWPVALSYLLSFIYVGIYWNNHHHLLRASGHINGRVLWHNLHLLFWITLIPFTTAWMSENHFASVPVALYGFVLLMTACAFFGLQHQLVKLDETARLDRAVGKDRKGQLSLLLYMVALGVSGLAPWLSCLLYAAVAALWFVPDTRFERAAFDA